MAESRKVVRKKDGGRGASSRGLSAEPAFFLWAMQHRWRGHTGVVAIFYWWCMEKKKKKERKKFQDPAVAF